MRIDSIASLRNLFTGVQSPPTAANAALTPRLPVEYLPSWKRTLGSTIGPFTIDLLQPIIRRRAALDLPHDRPFTVCIGERFSGDVSRRALLSQVHLRTVQRLLIPGSHFNSSEVRFWLRKNIAEITCVDLVDWGASWQKATNSMRSWYPKSRLSFMHGTIEQMPFPDGSFDLVTTEAVLEHVRNIPRMCSETARVLREGGMAWHTFGPLYFCHGGDHTIGSLGASHGFNHLLLSEKEYRDVLHDHGRFERLGKKTSDSRYWAIHDQFSFLKSHEYLSAFAKHFHILYVLVKVSPESLRYSTSYPERWKQMLSTGLTRNDLLIKGMSVILKKV